MPFHYSSFTSLISAVNVKLQRRQVQPRYRHFVTVLVGRYVSSSSSTNAGIQLRKFCQKRTRFFSDDAVIPVNDIDKFTTSTQQQPLHAETSHVDGDSVDVATIPGRDSLCITVNDELIEKVEHNSIIINEQMNDTSNETRNDLYPKQQEGHFILTYRNQPTYFQFDYRNHEPITDKSMINLLHKIEATLHNAQYEPLGVDRGVRTTQYNIDNMEDGNSYRLGRLKSKVKNAIVKPRKEKVETLNSRKLLRILKERHAIYTTGTCIMFSKMKPIMFGKGFYGPESYIEMKPKEAEIILRDLWFKGYNDRFRGLQRKHYIILRQKKRNREKLERLKEQEAVESDALKRSTEDEKPDLNNTSGKEESIDLISEDTKKKLVESKDEGDENKLTKVKPKKERKKGKMTKEEWKYFQMWPIKKYR